MNLKVLFIINAVLALLFGLAFVLIPGDTLAQYGVKLMPKAGIYAARLFGATLLGIAVISWFAQSLGTSEIRSAIILGFFVVDAVGFIVSLLAQVDGVVNNLGWTTVAIYLLLGVGFGYFRFMKADA
jgi:hypothetical protein